MSEHLEAFIEEVESRGRTLPHFVERELRRYLECGVLEYGFAVAVCASCGARDVVAFSCKGRGICPSCGGRRMADTAARLVDDVLPDAPVRQWVLSLPYSVRFLVAYDAALCSAVLSIFVSEVFGHLRRTAKRELGLGRLSDAHPGAVTVIQRGGSAGNVNPHYHSLVLDGVFVEGEGGPRFCALPAPSRAEVAQVAWDTCQRTMQLLAKRGQAPDTPVEEGSEGAIDPVLSSCAAASMQMTGLFGAGAGKPLLQLGLVGCATGRAASAAGRAAHGFDLHAGVRIAAGDRRGLERLARYVLRPPVANDRLSLTDDGRVRLRLCHPWKDGTTHIVMQPLDLIARLVALVPAPRVHTVRYHGVLAPRAKLRELIVPTPERNIFEMRQLPLFRWSRAERRAVVAQTQSATRRNQRIAWGQLLARVFGTDAVRCARCSMGLLAIKGFVTEPAVIRTTLEELGLWRGVPTSHPARAPPPQMELPFTAAIQDAAEQLELA